MNYKKNQEWLRVFEEVNSYMEANLEKWNSIEEIRRTYDLFINNLKKIRDLQPELEKDLNPVKEALTGKREILLLKLFPIGNILEVYAQDHPVGKNTEALLLAQKKFESHKNKVLLEHAIRLHKRCDRYMQEAPGEEAGDHINPTRDIKRYGLTRLMLDELYTICHQFQSALLLLKDVKTYRRKTMRKRSVLINLNRKLLKNRLNKLMSVFSGTHPSFYREYSRIVSKNQLTL